MLLTSQQIIFASEESNSEKHSSILSTIYSLLFTLLLFPVAQEWVVTWHFLLRWLALKVLWSGEQRFRCSSCTLTSTQNHKHFGPPSRGALILLSLLTHWFSIQRTSDNFTENCLKSTHNYCLLFVPPLIWILIRRVSGSRRKVSVLKLCSREA